MEVNESHDVPGNSENFSDAGEDSLYDGSASDDNPSSTNLPPDENQTVPVLNENVQRIPEAFNEVNQQKQLSWLSVIVNFEELGNEEQGEDLM